MKLRNIIVEYVDPNEIHDYTYGTGADTITFIYSRDHGLIAAPYRTTHIDLILDNGGLFGIPSGDATAAWYTARDKWTHIQNDCLLGRIGPAPEEQDESEEYNGNEIEYVSFWNNYDEIYHELLIKCLQELLSKNYIALDTTVSAPIFFDAPVSDFLTNYQQREASLPDEEDLKKRQEMHLLEPGEKRKALMAIGAKGGVKRPWQQALEREKIIQPGQKWWAPTSESYESK